MSVVLWVVQVLAGLAFILAGFMKVTQPIDRLSKQMEWVTHFSPAFVRFIGAVELLGGIGLIVPALTDILPWLTPLAAAGLAIVMVGAVGYHFQHKELNRIAPSLILLILALIIVFGRSVVQPIA